MEDFVYGSPFPFVLEEREINSNECAIGPFSLAEAVYVFWNIDEVSLLFNAHTYLKLESQDEEDATTLDESYADFPLSAACFAAQEPLMRGRTDGRDVLAALEDNTGGTNTFFISRPIMLPESGEVQDYAERKFMFPVFAEIGSIVQLTTQPTTNSATIKQVPLQMVGKTLNISLVIDPIFIDPPEGAVARYSADAQIDITFKQPYPPQTEETEDPETTEETEESEI